MSHVHGPGDHEHVTPVQPTTERQVIVTSGGDGGGAGWLIALIVLVVLIIGGIFLYQAVVESADEVSDGELDVNVDAPEDEDPDVVVPEDEGS